MREGAGPQVELRVGQLEAAVVDRGAVAEHHPDLLSRQVRAEAEMGAGAAEADVRVGVTPDVAALRVAGWDPGPP